MRNHMNNRGSATVEIAVVMAAFLICIFIIFQAWFYLLGQCNEYEIEVRQYYEKQQGIEEEMERLRRWKVLDSEI